jgi:large subunit ribosomal protein L6
MSRIGKKPIPVPAGVTVEINEAEVVVKGKGGELRQPYNSDMTIREEGGQILVERPSDRKDHRAMHGLYRALIANMITGVNEGFVRNLELVGYRVQELGTGINLQIGYSHPVVVQPMDGIKFEVEGNNRIKISGIDKQVVGEQAAQIRRWRPPDAYKGKGIRYAGERVTLKAGKSGARGAA